MKFAILALVALASVASADKETIYDKSGYLYRHFQATGHFKTQPFLDLYKQYFAAFKSDAYPNMPKDHPDRFRPSALICDNFFNAYVAGKYNLDDFDQFIVLDACLGYLYDEHHPEDEKPTEEQKTTFEKLASYKKIHDLYHDTTIGKFSDFDRTCIADLLMRSLLAKAKYQEVTCNNEMLQIYLQFAECVKHEGSDLLSHQDDSYVKIVLELVKKRGNLCFKQELVHIEQAVRKKFVNDRSVLDPLKRDAQSKQKMERMWPNAVVKLLRAITAEKGELSLRVANQLVSSFKRDDDKHQELFLKHLADYADSTILPHKGALRGLKSLFKPRSNEVPDLNGIKLDSEKDPRGVQAYTNLVDKLCNPFRSADNTNEFDFALSIIRLLELVKHEDIFNISELTFLNKLTYYTQEEGPIYLCVNACNIITNTVGAIAIEEEPGRPHYQVNLSPIFTDVDKWPVPMYM